MHPDDRDLLVTDLAAATGLRLSAAALLLDLATDARQRFADPTSDCERADLAALRACGAVTREGSALHHRPASWQLFRTDVRDTRLCVQTYGHGDVLVLAPPFGASHGLWGTPWAGGATQLRTFGRRFRTVCVDYRGTGCSDITAPPYGLEDFAADLVAVLDRLAIARAHLLGASLGGGVALRFALAHPERVASLVLCSTNASAIDAATRRKAEEFLSVAPARSLDWAMRAYLRTPLAGATPESVESMLAIGRRGIRTVDNFLNLYRANIFRSDVRRHLSEIRVPTLVIVGERDLAFFQEEGRILASEIVGARLVRVPGAGHVVWQHQPRTFNRVVLEFLAAQPAIAPGHSEDGPRVEARA